MPKQINLFLYNRSSYQGQTDRTMLIKPVIAINLAHSGKNKYPHPVVSVKKWDNYEKALPNLT